MEVAEGIHVERVLLIKIYKRYGSAVWLFYFV